MPRIGEIQKGLKIGKGKGYFIWQACAECNKERWVAFRIRQGKPRNLFCQACSCIEGWRKHPERLRGIRNPAWKSGRQKTTEGYAMRTLESTDFFYPMSRQSDGRVFEHRLIMAKHLKRCLLPWEVVHHKNSIKDDNRLENLELLPTNKQHLSSMKIQMELKKRDDRIANLEQRVTLLEAENTLLRQGAECVGEVKQ